MHVILFDPKQNGINAFVRVDVACACNRLIQDVFALGKCADVVLQGVGLRGLERLCLGLAEGNGLAVGDSFDLIL